MLIRLIIQVNNDLVVILHSVVDKSEGSFNAVEFGAEADTSSGKIPRNLRLLAIGTDTSRDGAELMAVTAVACLY